MYTRLTNVTKKVVVDAAKRYKGLEGNRDTSHILTAVATAAGGLYGAGLGLVGGIHLGENISDQTRKPLRIASQAALAASGAVVGGVVGAPALGVATHVATSTVLVFPGTTVLAISALSVYGLFNQQRQKEQNKKTNEDKIISTQVISSRKKNG